MIEHVHKHITSELQQNTRTDIIFILAAIILNLITLAINSGMAEESRTDSSMLLVMFIFIALLVLVNPAGTRQYSSDLRIAEGETDPDQTAERTAFDVPRPESGEILRRNLAQQLQYPLQPLHHGCGLYRGYRSYCAVCDEIGSEG